MNAHTSDNQSTERRDPMCIMNEAVSLAFALAILIFILDSGLRYSPERRAFIVANIAVIALSVLTTTILFVSMVFNPLEMLPTRIFVALINVAGVAVAVTFVHYVFAILIDQEDEYRRTIFISWILYGLVSALVIYVSLTSPQITYDTLGQRPDPYITVAPLSVLGYVLWAMTVGIRYRHRTTRSMLTIISALALVSVVSILLQIHLPEVMLNSITSVFILLVAALYLQNKKAFID